MTKRLLLLAALTIVLGNTWAQGPNGSGDYYKPANGKSGEALKTALFNIIKVKKHSPNYDELLELYKKTDTRPDGYVRDWYSNVTSYTHIRDKAGSYSKEGDCYNREHSVPQGWGAPKADIVHVVPTDGYVNNRRGDLPFGEVATVKYQSANGYSKMGSCKTPGYNSGNVFEPNDEVKGDLARIYFYMATCYEGTAKNWGHDVFTGTDYNPFSDWTYDMLVRWSQLDPVDDVEKGRNAAIAADDVQGNRNPFVDYPGLEEYIWGDKKNVAFSYDNYQGGGGESYFVALPTITPDAGTYYDEVTVEINCATEGAVIYYTMDGADASENSILYEGPFTLTETATIKAVAIVTTDEDVFRSYQASAFYKIRKTGEAPVDCEIALNNAFFETNYNGVVDKNVTEDFVGIQNGVTVVYALGTGGQQQRYVNDNEIRVYGGNTLTVSVGQGSIETIEFTLGRNNGGLSANVGEMEKAETYKWTGDASEIVFTGNNTSLRTMKVTVSGGTSSSIDFATTTTSLSGRRVVYNLRGQQVANPTHGLYLVDGKKVFIQ